MTHLLPQFPTCRHYRRGDAQVNGPKWNFFFSGWDLRQLATTSGVGRNSLKAFSELDAKAQILSSAMRHFPAALM